MNHLQFRISAERKREALESVAGSDTFVRADQLRRFLRYICDMEIAGRAEDISEYSIATAVLGRRAGYSPGDDSSVRSRAHALRRKLRDYYEAEGAAALLRIEIPKGNYVPIFVEHLEKEAIQTLAPVPDPAKDRWHGLRLLGIGAGAGIAVTAVAFLLMRVPGPAVPDPIVREAWGTMLQPHADVVVCIGSPPALLLKSFREGTLPSTPHLMTVPTEVTEWYANLHELDGGGDLYMQTSMNTMLSGDALAAVRAVRLLSVAGARPQVLPESGQGALALRGRNVVLIGSPNYSPYAGRLLRGTPFSVRYDTVKKDEVISAGPPESSTSQVFRAKRDEYGAATRVYGLLTVLPGEGRTQTVVFSGVGSAGTQAAMEFFSSDSMMQELKSRLKREGRAGFPPAYQVVIRCGVDRALALSWAYETHQVILKPPPIE